MPPSKKDDTRVIELDNYNNDSFNTIKTVNTGNDDVVTNPFENSNSMSSRHAVRRSSTTAAPGGGGVAAVGTSNHTESNSNGIYEIATREDASLIQNDDVAFGLDNETEFPEGSFKGWVTTIGSSLALMTVFGIMNTIGVISSYVQSHQLSSIPVSSVSWVFSLYMFNTLLWGVFVGAAFDTFGAKKILLPGMVLNLLGLFSLAECKTLWQFILAFGISSGIGSSLMLTPLIGVVSHWFLKKRGLALGLAQVGGSAAGIAFPLMLRSLYDRLGYGWSMRILAFICLGLCIISFFLVRDRLDEISGMNKNNAISSKDNDDNDINDMNESTFTEKLKASLDFNQLRDRKFTLLVSALFMNEFSLLLVITYLGTYAQAHGYTESTSYIVLTVLNSFGTLGKYLPAHFADYFGRYNMITLMSIIMSLSIFIIWLPFGSNLVALYIFAAIYGFAFAATYSLTPTCIGQISKTEQFGRRYGTAYFFVAFGNLISLPIGGKIIGKGSIKEYENMIIFAGVSCVFATALFIAARYAIIGKKIKVFV
ncbi:unnamed protein product [[Candida] boidinii]|uniref:Unnamed protein product n=1 Tax=Candida boidinii TaxID=5477 RepID=A0A9W6SVE5_CANBO|nr:hypothetical protein B5S30_g4205 [[Candida] boidinii]OWB85018.1 hypothetical protein B5S33_g3675 [[Candida] boidinii]GME67042.1 unnamed protein product [[Candida] boidinii]